MNIVNTEQKNDNDDDDEMVLPLQVRPPSPTDVADPRQQQGPPAERLWNVVNNDLYLTAWFFFCIALDPAMHWAGTFLDSLEDEPSSPLQRFLYGCLIFLGMMVFFLAVMFVNFSLLFLPPLRVVAAYHELRRRRRRQQLALSTTAAAAAEVAPVARPPSLLFKSVVVGRLLSFFVAYGSVLLWYKRRNSVLLKMYTIFVQEFVKEITSLMHWVDLIVKIAVLHLSLIIVVVVAIKSLRLVARHMPPLQRWLRSRWPIV